MVEYKAEMSLEEAVNSAFMTIKNELLSELS